MDTILSRILTIQEKTAAAVLNNADNITHIVKTEADMADMISRGQMQSIYAAKPPCDSRNMEGYQ